MTKLNKNCIIAFWLHNLEDDVLEDPKFLIISPRLNNFLKTFHKSSNFESNIYINSLDGWTYVDLHLHYRFSGNLLWASLHLLVDSTRTIEICFTIASNFLTYPLIKHMAQCIKEKLENPISFFITIDIDRVMLSPFIILGHRIRSIDMRGFANYRCIKDFAGFEMDKINLYTKFDSAYLVPLTQVRLKKLNTFGNTLDIMIQNELIHLGLKELHVQYLNHECSVQNLRLLNRAYPDLKYISIQNPCLQGDPNIKEKTLELVDIAEELYHQHNTTIKLDIMFVGSQLFKTLTINNNSNPVFNEYFEAIVDQAAVQKIRLSMFDEDTKRQDEELGRLSIPLSYFRKQKVVSKMPPG
ncbi:unnamed protein product [Bursaphelenchus okinawaensis]|uniref:C2 domain-containing protein n=1 Tax=Bursaphelenchus okinawaensis TaxID=465554 RepID=A0A811KFG0_9BILA|nr:unnamed protein product [Bursaphelenchus okinawaensis]CAG9101129.1 unnamed protein product [Bursaphelenchus okinawaensis]